MLDVAVIECAAIQPVLTEADHDHAIVGCVWGLTLRRPPCESNGARSVAVLSSRNSSEPLSWPRSVACGRLGKVKSRFDIPQCGNGMCSRFPVAHGQVLL